MVVKKKINLLKKKQKLINQRILKPFSNESLKKREKKKDMVALLDKGRKLSPAMGKRWKKGKKKFKGRGARAYSLYLIMARLLLLKRRYRFLARRIYGVFKLFSFLKINRPLRIFTSSIIDRNFTIVKSFFNSVLRYRVFNTYLKIGRKCAPVFAVRNMGVRQSLFYTRIKRAYFLKMLHLLSHKDLWSDFFTPETFKYS